MEMYRKVVPDYLSDQSYCSALAALHEYVVRHDGHKEALQYVKGLFAEGTWLEIQAQQSNLGGSTVIERSSKANNANLPFKELAENRHSIREYADQPVTYEELLPAIQLAMRTPTVCNRQPARLRIILNPELITKALNIQGGFNGYKIPPVLLLITADNTGVHGTPRTKRGIYRRGFVRYVTAAFLGTRRISCMSVEHHDERGTRKGNKKTAKHPRSRKYGDVHCGRTFPRYS